MSSENGFNCNLDKLKVPSSAIFEKIKGKKKIQEKVKLPATTQSYKLLSAIEVYKLKCARSMRS